MPQYKNNDTVDRALPGAGVVPAGATVETPYYVPLTTELAVWFSLEADGPAPIVTLVDGAIPEDPVTGDYGLCMYPRIRVNNKSGGELTVVMNSDTENPLKMPAGEILYLSNQKDINSLTFTGSGNISVVAFKKAMFYDI